MRPRFRSRYESVLATGIEARTGQPVSFETLKVPFVYPPRLATYTPDFLLPNGIIVEAKGLLDADDRQKMVLVKQQHPELDIRMIFQRDQRIYPKSQETYTSWCARNGIRAAVGTEVPAEWIAEAERPCVVSEPVSIHLAAAKAAGSWWRTPAKRKET